MRLENGHTEFFPGQSGEPGFTGCRGWESPYGIGLVLPLSLTSVEPGQDRYSSLSQLWRCANGGLWLISYNEGACEWLGRFMGEDLESAQEELWEIQFCETHALAYRIVLETDGLARSEVERVVSEKTGSDEFSSSLIRIKYDMNHDDEEYYTVYEFRDGSALRVLHPMSLGYEGLTFVEASMVQGRA